jgi:hypothetical protein
MSRLKTSRDWRQVESEKHVVVDEPVEAGELVQAEGPVEAEETVKAE